MHSSADPRGTAGRPPTARRLLLWCLVGLATTLLGFTVPSSASASYPGRAGTVAFQEYSGDIDENGAETDDWDVRFVHPSGDVTTGLSCEGIDLTDFSGHGTQYCPRFRQNFGPDKGLDYSPDGQSLVVAGALYQDDGTRTPLRAGCPGHATRSSWPMLTDAARGSCR